MDYFSNWYFPNKYFPPQYWGGQPGDTEITPPTVIYDAPSWSALEIITELPAAFKATIAGFSTVAVSISANGEPNVGFGGTATVNAGLSAAALFAAIVASETKVVAKITGIFDYVTDDNNFWLLAD